jgi:uncharacterized membrane protein (UPF0127 family)
MERSSRMKQLSLGILNGGRIERRPKRELRRRQVSLFTQSGACLAMRVRVANTVVSRFIGLLARKELAHDEGLLLVRGGTVHTFGMRFAIDLVFLDREMRVEAFSRDVRPWRISLAPPRTAFVLELPAGRIGSIKLNAQERLVMRTRLS